MRGKSQPAQKHHDQDSRQPPEVVETLSEGMDELCRVLSPPPIHWSKGSAVFQLCPRRSWLTIKLSDSAVRQRNTTHACEIAWLHHVSDLRKVQGVDTSDNYCGSRGHLPYFRLLAGSPCAVKRHRGRSSRAEAYHEGQRRCRNRRSPTRGRSRQQRPLTLRPRGRGEMSVNFVITEFSEVRVASVQHL